MCRQYNSNKSFESVFQIVGLHFHNGYVLLMLHSLSCSWHTLFAFALSVFCIDFSHEEMYSYYCPVTPFFWGKLEFIKPFWCRFNRRNQKIKYLTIVKDNQTLTSTMQNLYVQQHMKPSNLLHYQLLEKYF